jgi:hypothetical protein
MKYTELTEDKFNKTKTYTWNAFPDKPDQSIILNINSRLNLIWFKGGTKPLLGGAKEALGMGMRYITAEKDGIKSESVVIDYEFHDFNWIFLRKGGMQILLDGNTSLTLKATEKRSDSYIAGVGENSKNLIYESGYYELSLDQFKQICFSKTVEVRVAGNFKIDFELENNNKFHFMMKSLYNDVIDNSAFKEEIENMEKEKELEDKKNQKYAVGCLIAVVIIIIILWVFW